MRSRDVEPGTPGEPVLLRFRATRAWYIELAFAPLFLALAIAQLVFDERGAMTYVWLAGGILAMAWCIRVVIHFRRGLELTRNALRLVVPGNSFAAPLADVANVALLHDRSLSLWMLHVWGDGEPLVIPFVCSRKPRVGRDTTAPLDVDLLAQTAAARVAQKIYDAAREAQSFRRRLGATNTRAFLQGEHYGEIADAYWSPDGTFGRLESLLDAWSATPEPAPRGVSTIAGPTPSPPAMERGHAKLMSVGWRRSGRIGLGVAMAVGIIALVPSIFYDDSEQLIARGIRVPGVVTAVHGEDLMDIAFEQGGQQRTARIVRDSTDGYKLGQPIVVVYDETDPARVRTTKESNPPMWTMTISDWGGTTAVLLFGVSLILLAKSWRATRRARRLAWHTCRFTVHYSDERYASLLIQPTDSLTPLELGVRRTGPFASAVGLRDGVGYVVLGAGS